MVGYVVDHLDNVNDSNQRLFHLRRIFQVDGMACLLDGAKELGIVGGLYVILGDAPVNIVPYLEY